MIGRILCRFGSHDWRYMNFAIDWRLLNEAQYYDMRCGRCGVSHD